MGSIFMVIGNILIVKYSSYYSSSVKAEVKEAYIDLWERRGEERRGEERE